MVYFFDEKDVSGLAVDNAKCSTGCDCCPYDNTGYEDDGLCNAPVFCFNTNFIYIIDIE